MNYDDATVQPQRFYRVRTAIAGAVKDLRADRLRGNRGPAKNRLFARAKRGAFLMAGQGSTGNVIAALCSFFIPGLGQLIQGRVLMALVQFVLAGLLWLVLLGWLVHLWSIVDAAMFKPR